MSESIKITGEWRVMKTLTPGIWLSRLRGLSDATWATSISHECKANSDREYFGPLEIIEPEPEPTPLPGCRCELTIHAGGECYCKSIGGLRWKVIAHGNTRRQAILRHNAAVAAIMKMEGSQ